MAAIQNKLSKSSKRLVALMQNSQSAGVFKKLMLEAERAEHIARTRRAPSEPTGGGESADT